MKYFRRRENDEGVSYWISFSDIMSGILIVFILLFIFELLRDKGGGYKAHDNTLTATEQYSTSGEKTTREEIISRMSSGFKGQGLDIKMDNNTGVILLSEEILFDYGSSEIKPEGKELLKQFVPIYVDVLLSDDAIKEQLYDIIVEGHTDTDSSYLYNLKLSQERAYSVVEYMLSDEVKYEHKDEVQKYLTANGRSFSQAVINTDGTVNADASRRVELKFRLKEDETILKIQRNFD